MTMLVDIESLRSGVVVACSTYLPTYLQAALIIESFKLLAAFVFKL